MKVLKAAFSYSPYTARKESEPNEYSPSSISLSVYWLWVLEAMRYSIMRSPLLLKAEHL